MATQIVATNHLTGGRSVLSLGHIDLDAEIPARVFDRSVVRERLRSGREAVPEEPGDPRTGS